MTRRTFLTAAGAVCITPFVPRRVAAQDVEFIRALERAQQDRPANVASRARIAPAEEPGTPLVIRGRLFAADQRTPLPGAIVFAYHTDREGHYNRPGSAAHSWRLRGWSRTDSDGRFEFETIRPGAYPSRNIAAHVHFTVFNGSERYHAGELQFEDDAILRDSDRARSRERGAFGEIRPVRREGQVEHVEVALKVDPAQRF
jgi:protocatechuate 3,4-dioxygenase, beta subunit